MKIASRFTDQFVKEKESYMTEVQKVSKLANDLMNGLPQCRCNDFLNLELP